MEKTKLSGIERELVLQYLIDGNVPVTITPVENSSAESDGKIHPLNSVSCFSGFLCRRYK